LEQTGLEGGKLQITLHIHLYHFTAFLREIDGDSQISQPGAVISLKSCPSSPFPLFPGQDKGAERSLEIAAYWNLSDHLRPTLVLEMIDISFCDIS
jgi:hypothetical protein